MHPALGFGVAVNKGQSAGAIVIMGGIVGKLRYLRVFRIAPHGDGKVAQVQAVFPHVHKQPSVGGAGIDKVACFQINPVTVVIGLRLQSPAAAVKAHGHGTNSRPPLSLH